MTPSSHRPRTTFARSGTRPMIMCCLGALCLVSSAAWSATAPALPATGAYQVKDPQTTSARCARVTSSESPRQFTLSDNGAELTCLPQQSTRPASASRPASSMPVNTALCASTGGSEVVEVKFTARSLQEVSRLQLGGDGTVVASRITPPPGYALDTRSTCPGVL